MLCLIPGCRNAFWDQFRPHYRPSALSRIDYNTNCQSINNNKQNHGILAAITFTSRPEVPHYPKLVTWTTDGLWCACVHELNVLKVSGKIISRQELVSNFNSRVTMFFHSFSARFPSQQVRSTETFSEDVRLGEWHLPCGFEARRNSLLGRFRARQVQKSHNATTCLSSSVTNFHEIYTCRSDLGCRR